MQHTSRHAAPALAFLLLGSTSALAVEAQPFAERLQSVLTDQSVTMTFTGAEERGSDVVIQGVAIASPEGGATELGDVTFENVTGSPADGYSVETVPFADIDVAREGTRTQVRGMTIDGLEIAGTGEASQSIGGLYFARAAVGDVAVEREGRSVFTLAGTQITNTYPEGGTFTSDFQLGDFTADFTAGNDPAGAQVMEALGYGQVSGSASGMATWDPATGELALEPFTLDVADAGELTFAYAITGYTPSFIESLSQLQQQMAASPANQEASGMAIIGLVSQLSLNSVNLAYEDASLAGKLLDYYAEENGVPRAEFVQTLNTIVPQAIVALQNPEFQEEVTSAVSAFLADPQSFSISIDPAQPIPAAQVIGAALGAPQTLPDVLDVQISANEGTGAPDAAQDEPADGNAVEAPSDADAPEETTQEPGRN